MIEILCSEETPAFGHWTAYKDAVPEIGEACLCQTQSGLIEVMTFGEFGFNTFNGGMNTHIEVVAWMPLPAPFREVK